MSPTFITVSASAPLGEALRLMAADRIGYLPVVDERGTLVGMVSTDDVLAAARAHPSPIDVVATVVRGPVASIDPAMPLREVARRMEEANIEAFPVVEDGRVVGILARSDVGLDALPAGVGRS